MKLFLLFVKKTANTQFVSRLLLTAGYAKYNIPWVPLVLIFIAVGIPVLHELLIVGGEVGILSMENPIHEAIAKYFSSPILSLIKVVAYVSIMPFSDNPGSYAPLVFVFFLKHISYYRLFGFLKVFLKNNHHWMMVITLLCYFIASWGHLRDHDLLLLAVLIDTFISFKKRYWKRKNQEGSDDENKNQSH